MAATTAVATALTTAAPAAGVAALFDVHGEFDTIAALARAPGGRRAEVVTALATTGRLGGDGLAALVEAVAAGDDAALAGAVALPLARHDLGQAAQVFELLLRLGRDTAASLLARALLDASGTAVRPLVAPAPRSVVTGTGRCGTGFTTEVLRALGHPVGHEEGWTVDPGRRRGHLAVGVSWLAAPFLADHAGPVVQQVRDPLEVVRSLVGIGMFSDPAHGAYRWFVHAHEPGLGLDDVTAAVRWYVRWNTRIEPHAGLRLRVEDLDVDGVVALLAHLALPTDRGRVADALAATGARVNSRPRADGIDWGDLPDTADTAALHAMAARYGYPT